MNLLEQTHQSQTTALRLEQLTLNLSELYANHHRWLVKLLSRKLSCPHSAADIAQDTFVKVLGKSEPIPIQEPRAYLTTIAHGLMVNYLRRRDMERAYLAALSALEDSQQNLYNCPETLAIAVEKLIIIDRMLDGLPTKVRTAFLLHKLDGLSYAEIADQMQVSVISIKKYIAKALLHCASER